MIWWSVYPVVPALLPRRLAALPVGAVYIMLEQLALSLLSPSLFWGVGCSDISESLRLDSFWFCILSASCSTSSKFSPSSLFSSDVPFGSKWELKLESIYYTIIDFWWGLLMTMKTTSGIGWPMPNMSGIGWPIWHRSTNTWEGLHGHE